MVRSLPLLIYVHGLSQVLSNKSITKEFIFAHFKLAEIELFLTKTCLKYLIV